jgi:hypothetical protein
MGYRDATGWHVIAQTPKQMSYGTYYQMLLSVNGTTTTLTVNGSTAFTYTYGARYIDGVRYALNKGMVGMGSNNARGSFDNVRVQVLPPQITLDSNTDLTGGTGPLGPPTSGTWTGGSGGYTGTPQAPAPAALVLVTLPGGVDNLESTSWLRLTATLRLTAGGMAGVAFDVYSDRDFKFALLDLAGQRVVLGHHDPRAGYVIDAVFAQALAAGTAYTLDVQLKGTSASITLNGLFMVSTGFNAGVSDGRFGLLVRSGSATFSALRVRTDDTQFIGTGPPPPPPAELPTAVIDDVTVVEGTGGTKTVTLTVTLSAPPADGTVIRIPWTTADLTAVFGADYGLASGVLQFSAGVTQQQIVLTIVTDSLVEADEVFTVQLSASSGVTLLKPVGRVTIIDDDTAPPPPTTPAVTVGSTSIREGNGGTTTATLTLTLSAVTNVDVVVQVRVTGGSATAGGDYRAWSPLTQQVVIRAGQRTATVSIDVVGDRVSEADETVVVEVVGITGATGLGTTGTLTILDDDRKLVTATAGPGAEAVSTADVSRVLAAAVRIWRDAGADAALLARISVVVAPMAALELGEASGTVIRISPNAAGWGWSTSLDSVVPGRIDLLSVLVHEIGHILGLEHADSGVMVDLLLPGERLVAATVQAPVSGSQVGPVPPATGSPAAALVDTWGRLSGPVCPATSGSTWAGQLAARLADLGGRLGIHHDPEGDALARHLVEAA